MPLSKSEFWSLVGTCVHDDTTTHRSKLKQHLDKLSDEDVAYFVAHHSAELKRLHHWDVRAVAYAVMGGCSDDGFVDFRGWLVLKGREACEQVLSSPEKLIPVFSTLDDRMEEYLAFPSIYWEERSVSVDLPDLGDEPATTIAGSRFDPEDLVKRFPALCQAFDSA